MRWRNISGLDTVWDMKNWTEDLSPQKKGGILQST